MGTIYITTEDSFITKVDERLVVKADKKSILDVPLIKTDGLVVIGRCSVTPALISELLTRKIPLSYLTQGGKYLGRLEPELGKNIFVRQAQWQAASNIEFKTHVVKGFIRGKLKNYRNLLQKRSREYSELDLNSNIDQIKHAINSLETTEDINGLRGYEGIGSKAYFGCFDKLIKNPTFAFDTRRRRPPTDPVNSLLSLGYSLLRNEIQSALNIVGFDPYLGYLHTARYGRPSLALDLMEEFRPIVADAVVLTLINRNFLCSNDFVSEPISNAVYLTKDGLRTFLTHYEQKKQSTFKHPVLQTKCTYREAFEIQARLLAKYLMQEIDKYPPLVLS
ncbi:type I-D CRISPR-associated endonuclease Cas1d [Merismopedia glauca]|uniref:CRISPR-associated endonuclease Cas1 n=1 Tax=Merismopedia glauca CCAP 1448/3 TaxID=1296344 RepID=A0A2T1BYM7_9CYAN|nr:type I-D CRISPR-associated endonuclease Cas1d [Merismopedia glauca]PSB01136.1 type I-D CRISPR-associated endonuclease Cas1 [Merismopedia glauca CCAP 1448/3]